MNNRINNRNKYYINEKLAEYKNEEYIKLISELKNYPYDKVLKTDLYEEAHEKDAVLLSMSNRYGRIFGIDISYDIGRRAKSALADKHGRFKNVSPFIVADVRKIPFKKDTFDLVISPSTLDHFPEIEIAIKEIYRILKPNGELIITINNKCNPFFVFNSYFLHTLGVLPFKNFHYSPGGIEKILKSNGFFIKDKRFIVHIPFLYPTISNLFQSLNMRCLSNLDSFCISSIKKYSSCRTILHHLTGWLVAVIAEKCG